jgi:hypothetical protein
MEGEAAGRESKGKGKGKDAEPNPEGTPGHDAADKQPAGALLPQMVQSAASFLLSAPPGAGLGGGSEKGEPSRAVEALARAGESSVQLRSNIPSGGTMRTGQAQEHISREEASFAAFLDSEDAPMLSEPHGSQAGWQSAVPGSCAFSMVAKAEEPASNSVAEQQAKDGADVVALLSRDGDLDQVFEHVSHPPSQNDLAGLRKALFGEDPDQSSSTIAWDNILNFIPEYLQAETATLGDDRSMHLGVSDAGEAWQTWVGQWSRVLTSYQDEVWGDLGALVDEARTEIQRIEGTKPGQKPPEPTALLRLRAVLGHLRGAS